MTTPHFNRIELQLFGDFVYLCLECEPWLRRAVPSLWTAWRLIGEHPESLELVSRYIVGHRLKRAGVKRARDAIAAISAAVQKRSEVHRGDRSVFLHTCLDPHQHRVPPTMTIEYFFSRESNLHRASGNHRQFCDGHLMVERIALATESASVWSRNHADVTCR